jgi:hypothetical protein
MSDTTIGGYLDEVAGRLYERCIDDEGGHLAATIARVWASRTDPATFDLDGAIDRMLTDTDDHDTESLAIRPAELLPGDVLADGGTVASAPMLHPSGWLVAEVDYRVQRRFQPEALLQVSRPVAH